MELNFIWMALTFIMINVNGKHDQAKWPTFWQEVPRADVLCLQEMHLIKQQEKSLSCMLNHMISFFHMAPVNQCLGGS